MKRPPWGALIVVFPFLEIFGLIWVGSQIGFLLTVLFVLLGIVLGSWMIQSAGRRSFAAMAAGVRTGRPPQGDLAQTAWIVAGGVLFIVPGFLTDVLALVVVAPPTRRLLGRLTARFVPVTRVWVRPTVAGDDQTEPTVVRGDVL